MAASLDNIKPGQRITLTVTGAPRRQDECQTIARLMRQDPEIRRRLKGAQEHRMRNVVVRSRGKRPWVVREKASRYARAEKGASWSMIYIPQVAADLRSVSKFLDVKPA